MHEPSGEEDIDAGVAANRTDAGLPRRSATINRERATRKLVPELLAGERKYPDTWTVIDENQLLVLTANERHVGDPSRSIVVLRQVDGAAESAKGRVFLVKYEEMNSWVCLDM